VFAPPEREEAMALQYRGSSVNPTEKAVETKKFTANYRGATYVANSGHYHEKAIQGGNYRGAQWSRT
tara:strand:+ start:632 stop:832 length:201 start_codon:yes stop_codon:yes gene_type:complete